MCVVVHEIGFSGVSNHMVFDPQDTITSTLSCTLGILWMGICLLDVLKGGSSIHADSTASYSCSILAWLVTSLKLNPILVGCSAGTEGKAG